MILENGDIVLVSHRRMFDGDQARYFLGRTIGCEGSLLKVEGFSFVRDLSNGHVIKKPEKRIKLLSLDSPGHIVYQLPDDVHVGTVEFASHNGDAYLVDGARRLLDLSEHTHCGHF